ncbi:MAG TPA: CehA/McbA family metallohydrolase, partial [Bryobacteraceae bacterium]|nr:CehA/McbA family metallohydrolase [Bryobacteraceae bacterium]
FYTASPRDLGPHDAARGLSDASAGDRLIRTLHGRQQLRGVPFELGPSDPAQKAWIVLSRRAAPGLAPRAELAVGAMANYLCLAQFCNWDEAERPAPGADPIERVGEVLAEVGLVYEDGSRHSVPIRRRFEVNALNYAWGHLCFAAEPHRAPVPRKLSDPLPNGFYWGDLQLAVWDPNYPSDPSLDWQGTLWLSAIENPSPEKQIRSLILEARSEDWLAVAGVTLCRTGGHPLRYERLSLYRFTLPPGEDGPWEVSVDTGVVARSYRLPPFDAAAWLSSPVRGLSEPRPDERTDYLYAEVAATGGATLTLANTKTGGRWDFDVREITPGGEVEGRERGTKVQLLEREKVWLRGAVTDATNGKPTPVRIAFRSRDGRYLPPYGHRTEINSAWFQDYGADLKWGDTSFCYVDGTFQIELPVGEVYVEITKGFEYEPVRKRLQIDSKQRELSLEISRFADLRRQNWVTADTHVHFLSPTTAILEAQAEGLNLINVLAAQWGDLFTNVGDISYGPLASKDGDTLIWVGTENRQHILGHIGLLGNHDPVYPMGASGPEESYIGTPVLTSLAEWADACREREGLVVAVHFPFPTAELAADIVLGKIDAVELWPVNITEHFNNLRFLDWYRCLNCGYRLPAVAGTDKMGAWIPAGAYRAYARLGENEFNFANWAKAVREGNTFMSSGPLLFFEADGRSPGGEITFRSGGGSVEVRAEVKSTVPVHRLDIVVNGKVVASREAASGVRELTLRETLKVSGPGWIAARCASKHLSAGTRIAAHTSPVYLVVPGEEAFSAPAAAYLLTLIDG